VKLRFGWLFIICSCAGKPIVNMRSPLLENQIYSDLGNILLNQLLINCPCLPICTGLWKRSLSWVTIQSLRRTPLLSNKCQKSDKKSLKERTGIKLPSISCHSSSMRRKQMWRKTWKVWWNCMAPMYLSSSMMSPSVLNVEMLQLIVVLSASQNGIAPENASF